MYPDLNFRRIEMAAMRAKMKLNKIETYGSSETLHFNAVCKSEGYPADGSDEDNTFAMWTPTAELKMQITNPALVGSFKEGEVFYVDFTKVE
jgi:hypothetical protein